MWKKKKQLECFQKPREHDTFHSLSIHRLSRPNVKDQRMKVHLINSENSYGHLDNREREREEKNEIIQAVYSKNMRSEAMPAWLTA